jgi:hypothetical protein
MKEQLSALAITAVQVLSPVVIALLGLLAKKLIDLINARVKNEAVQGILDRLDQTALAVVTQIQQTVVDNLDPSAPKESLIKARDAALANLKTLLGQKGLDDIKNVLGLGDDSLDKILVMFIEKRVHDLKQKSAPAPTTPATSTPATPPPPPVPAKAASAA